MKCLRASINHLGNLNDMDVTELMIRAYKVASHSPDTSNQNGAVLIDRDGQVAKEGCNNFPRGFEPLPEHMERPRKYNFINHAEWSACTGIKAKGMTLICPWFACTICARTIVLSGVRCVIGHLPRMNMTPDRWLEDVKDGDYILDRAGVERDYMTQTLLLDEPVIINGVEHYKV